MKSKIDVAAMVLFANFFVGEKKKVWDEDIKMHIWSRTQIHLTPDNWETHKQEFMESRLHAWAEKEQYKSFTRKEVVLLELDHVKAISPQNRVEKTMLNRYIALLEKEQNTKDKPKQARLSYQWKSNPDIELPKLYTAMKDTGLIDESTRWEPFRAIFTGQPLEDIEPIVWKDRAVLLAYFINQLQQREVLKGFPNMWRIAQACFRGHTRKNLEQAHQNYLGNKSGGRPKRHNIIDALF